MKLARNVFIEPSLFNGNLKSVLTSFLNPYVFDDSSTSKDFSWCDHAQINCENENNWMRIINSHRATWNLSLCNEKFRTIDCIFFPNNMVFRFRIRPAPISDCPFL